MLDVEQRLSEEIALGLELMLGCRALCCRCECAGVGFDVDRLVIYHWRPVRVRAPSGEAWAKDEREEITVTAEKCKERDEGARILGAMVTSAR